MTVNLQSLLFQMTINLKKIKKFIGTEVKTIISFEKLESPSLLIADIYSENTKDKMINKNIKNEKYQPA